MNKTLIVILAETRAHHLTFSSFYRNLLTCNEADLALCVAQNQWEETDNPFYRHATHVWTYPEPDDWSTAIDYAQQCENSLDRDWRQLFGIHGIFLGGLHHKGQRTRGSGGILLFFRWFLKYCLRNEPGVMDYYDRFVVTRSDYYYPVPHYPIAKLAGDNIWIPNGEDYGGYTDRHIIADRLNILKTLSVLDPVLKEPTTLRRRLESKRDLNLEKYIYEQFHELDLIRSVRRYPYTMYAVRDAEGRTSWSHGTYFPNLGYHVKYKPEYIQSLVASRMVHEPSDWHENTTAAFLIVSRWPTKLQLLVNDHINTMRPKSVRQILLRLCYGTLLSDRFYTSVYPHLALIISRLLDVVRWPHSRLRGLGFLRDSDTAPGGGETAS